MRMPVIEVDVIIRSPRRWWQFWRPRDARLAQSVAGVDRSWRDVVRAGSVREAMNKSPFKFTDTFRLKAIEVTPIDGCHGLYGLSYSFSKVEEECKPSS